VWRYERKHPLKAAALEQPTKARVIRLTASEEFDRSNDAS
jgi:hypothetical protein